MLKHLHNVILRNLGPFQLILKYFEMPRKLENNIPHHLLTKLPLSSHICFIQGHPSWILSGLPKKKKGCFPHAKIHTGFFSVLNKQIKPVKTQTTEKLLKSVEILSPPITSEVAALLGFYLQCQLNQSGV